MGPGHATRGKPSGLVTSPLAVIVPIPRVWLVVSHEEGRERPIALVLDALRERYEEHPAAHFRGIEVRRFELTATAGAQPGESR